MSALGPPFRWRSETKRPNSDGEQPWGNLHSEVTVNKYLLQPERSFNINRIQGWLGILPPTNMFLNASARSWAYLGPGPNPAVEAFHRQLPDYNITPLIDLPETAKELGVRRVLVKDESHRFGLPAFKILGASWAIYNAVASECGLSLPCSLETLGSKARSRNLRLVTCTEGNWGRATARMAKYLQIPATVFVPKFMDVATQRKISGEGAEVVVVNGDYDMSIEAARELANNEGNLLVMDVSWEGYEEVPRVCLPDYQYANLDADHTPDSCRRLQYNAH